MRYAKLGLGLAVLLLAIWIIVGEQLSGASADATINAPVVVLRSPVAGVVDVRKRQIGSSVNAADVIATVSDPLPDRSRLADLELEHDTAAAQLKSLTAQKAAAEDALARMKQRSEIYRKDRIADLMLQLKFAQQQLDQAKAQQGAAQNGGAQSGGAQAGRAGSAAHANGGGGDQSRAEERVAMLTNAIAAAEGGVFLGDGAGEMSFSEQQALMLTQSIATLTARMAEARDAVTAIETRIRAERKSLNQSGLASISAQVDGIYWQELARDGTYVNRGDPIARVVDCGAELVTASVPEGTYQRLQRGMQVTFRANGDGKILHGVIVRLAGVGARTLYETMAVAPTEKHLQRYDVAVSIPALASDDTLSCAIGRTGRVFFDARPLDRLRNLF